MSLKTKFRLFALFLAVFFLINLGGLYYSYRETVRLLQKEQSISALFESITELQFLTFEYVQRPLPRMEKQILIKLNNIEKLMQGYDICKDCDENFVEIISQNENLGILYGDLFQAQTMKTLPLAEQELWQDLLVGQLMVNSQSMVINLITVSRHIREQFIFAHQLKDIISFGVIFTTYLITVSALYYIYRNIVFSLNKISRAAEISATGSLKEGLVDLQTKDEIGMVAKAYNQMVHKLDGSYEALKKEVELRREAEENLLQLNRTLEERIARRTKDLEEKNIALQSFTYSVSHDLKAPLRGIDGYSQILLEDYSDKLDEEGQGFLKIIRRAANNMNQLIEDLLLYSRLEEKAWVFRRIKLADFVEELIQDYRKLMQRRGGAIATSIVDLEISADQEGLALIIRNFVDNAVKFTEQSREPKIEIRADMVEGSLVISVHDNGIGFDMKYHDRIFGIFNRLHRQEEFPGTGIGLAMVFKASERMGGRVWAESAPGEGSSFYFELPEEKCK